MMPDRSVRAHTNHSINQANDEHSPREVLEEEKQGEWQQAKHPEPTDHRRPVFLGFEDVHPRKDLKQQPFRTGLDEFSFCVFQP